MFLIKSKLKIGSYLCIKIEISLNILYRIDLNKVKVLNHYSKTKTKRARGLCPSSSSVGVNLLY